MIIELLLFQFLIGRIGTFLMKMVYMDRLKVSIPYR